MAEGLHEHYVRFVETAKVNLAGYTLIEGFPGIGLAGTIAGKYLVERLEVEEIGYLDSDMFIPIIRIHNGFPVHPSRIYISKKNKIVIFLSEQIIPKSYNNLLGNEMVSWIKAKKIKKVISLGGIQADQQNQDIYGIAANAKSKKALKAIGAKIIEDGITTGITALMLLKLQDLDIEAFSIMGVVKTGADYQASAALVKKLNEILGLEIKVEPLMKEAQQTEQALLKQMATLKKTQGEMSRMEEIHAPLPPMTT